jgi:hypothetical protein
MAMTQDTSAPTSLPTRQDHRWGAQTLGEQTLRALAGFGGALAWLLQLLIAYTLAEFGCVAGWQQSQVWGIGWVSFLIGLVSLLMLALALLSAWVAQRRADQLQGQTPESSTTAPTDLPATKEPSQVAPVSRSARPFWLRISVLCNIIFAWLIVVQTLPILAFVRKC